MTEDKQQIEVAPINWANVRPEKVSQVLRLSELYLAGQLTRLEQADKRALGLISVGVAAALATFGASISALSNRSVDSSIAWGGVGAAVALLVSALFAFRALDTNVFFIAGNVPINLLDKNDLETRPDSELIGEYASFNQAGIEANADILRSRSRNIKLAVAAFLASPVVGITVIIISQLVPWAIRHGCAAFL